MGRGLFDNYIEHGFRIRLVGVGSVNEPAFRHPLQSDDDRHAAGGRTAMADVAFDRCNGQSLWQLAKY